MNHLTTFYKGFHSFTSMSVETDFIRYNCSKVYDACDDARKRINELNSAFGCKGDKLQHFHYSISIMKNGRYEIGDTFEYQYGDGSIWTATATVLHVWSDGKVRIGFIGFNGYEEKELY